MAENEDNTIGKIFKVGETGLWSVFLIRCVLIIAAASAVGLPAISYLKPLLSLSTNITYVLVFCLYIIPLLTNFAFFSYNRWPFLRLRFSKKTNVVFAHNLMATNEKKVRKQYLESIYSIQNQFDRFNLGDDIRFFESPSDIRFKKDELAEAKAILALKGRTILVWGHAAKDSKGVHFVTRFSYEFDHSASINKEKAKDQARAYTDKVMSEGLFLSNNGVNIETFKDQMFPTILFLLAFSNNSFQPAKKSAKFLEAFAAYFKQSSLSRKQDLAYAYYEIGEMLIKIYRFQMPNLSVNMSKERRELAKLLSEKILAWRDRDYDALCILAYIHDLIGDRPSSLAYYQRASNVALKGTSVHLFNKAYFSFCDNEYSRGLDEYETIHDRTEVIIGDVSNYLNKKYVETGNMAFKFADGYVLMRWGDRVVGREVLREFCERADHLLHAPLIKKAQVLLKD